MEPFQKFLKELIGVLREFRLAQGITQTELADLMDTTQGAVARFESESQPNFRFQFIFTYSQALDFPLYIAVYQAQKRYAGKLTSKPASKPSPNQKRLDQIASHINSLPKKEQDRHLRVIETMLGIEE